MTLYVHAHSIGLCIYKCWNPRVYSGVEILVSEGVYLKVVYSQKAYLYTYIGGVGILVSEGVYLKVVYSQKAYLYTYLEGVGILVSEGVYLKVVYSLSTACLTYICRTSSLFRCLTKFTAIPASMYQIFLQITHIV